MTNRIPEREHIPNYLKITNNIRSSISDMQKVMIKTSEIQISAKIGLETLMQSMQIKNNLLKKHFYKYVGDLKFDA